MVPHLLTCYTVRAKQEIRHQNPIVDRRTRNSIVIIFEKKSKHLQIMTITKEMIAAIILILSLVFISASEEENNANRCPLWLAPSYTGTKEDPKYALIAGKTYKASETLSRHAELAIPLVDFNMVEFNRNTPTRNKIVEFLEGFSWAAPFVGSQWEGNVSAPLLIPSIGVLPNYHTGISNVDFSQAAVLLRDSPEFLIAGQPHLSRGAITTYSNVTLKAIKEIPQGMELFADFGDVWDGNHVKYEENAYQDKITRLDYEKADTVIQALVEFYDEFPNLSLEFQEEILDFMLEKVLGAALGKSAKTIRSLIPANPRKLKRVGDLGGSFMYRYSDMIRPTKWLLGNGFCLDTLKAGASTIPSAGRGAFATQSFREGETITISPMLHIADKELLNMFPLQSLTKLNSQNMYFDYDRSGGSIGKQLLINYCFGHPESSLLLFPLGSMVNLINHSLKNSNAYITWSRRADILPNRHEYHDYTVEAMASIDKIVLTMKVVATKQIEPDDEIFLDYGPLWEAAWQEYQSSWEQNKDQSRHPLKAIDVAKQYETRPFQTAQTILQNPYPRDVATACYLKKLERRPDGKPMFDAAAKAEILEWSSPSMYEDYRGDTLFIVDVLDRKLAPDFFYNYTVKTHSDIIVGVPHSACTFIDQPYKSDMHIHGAFRHSIGIIDSHFPQKWRDLRDV
jgi:hypothetical protein